MLWRDIWNYRNSNAKGKRGINMADIELVIKIDEDIAHGIIDGENDEPRNIVRGFQATIADAIKNGTPLPKGHGKIVDIDKLINSKCNECGHIRGVSCTIPCYAVRRMLAAPPIIEADTGK